MELLILCLCGCITNMFPLNPILLFPPVCLPEFYVALSRYTIYFTFCERVETRRDSLCTIPFCSHVSLCTFFSTFHSTSFIPHDSFCSEQLVLVYKMMRISPDFYLLQTCLFFHCQIYKCHKMSSRTKCWL